MDQLIEFIIKLLSPSDWPPRWVCGKWSEFHGWLYIGSDIGIWLAYFIIPVIIIWFIQQKPDVPFLPVFWLFGAFIILCGTTHLIDAVIFWWPAYRLSALIKFFTAIISFITVYALIRDLPKVLELKPSSSNDDIMRLESEIKSKTQKIKELQSIIDSHKTN